jgi:hypothetical protein
MSRPIHCEGRRTKPPTQVNLARLQVFTNLLDNLSDKFWQTFVYSRGLSQHNHNVCNMFHASIPKTDSLSGMDGEKSRGCRKGYCDEQAERGRSVVKRNFPLSLENGNRCTPFFACSRRCNRIVVQSVLRCPLSGETGPEMFL